MISGIELTPYRLPLTRSWRSARGWFEERSGWLLCVRSGRVQGYGDCAPLPKAGTEDPAMSLGALNAWRSALTGMPLGQALALIQVDDSPAPAARFALESALADIASRLEGMPLRRWLRATASDSVEINAFLGPLRGLNAEAIEENCGSGHRVLKLKLGLEAPDLELRRLRELACGLPPGLALRLDANGAWTPDEAARVIEALDGLPVESLEEPLREPDPETLRNLQAKAPFSLALDESLSHGSSQVALEGLPVRRIVLKPGVVGGLRRTLNLAEQATRLGIEVVLTSLVETAAGLWPTLQLAAALSTPLPHGLATSSWLARDLGPAPIVARGRIRLPEGSGNGFHPYEA